MKVRHIHAAVRFVADTIAHEEVVFVGGDKVRHATDLTVRFRRG